MKALVRILIAIGCVICFVGGLIFVFGQALCIILDMPEMVIQIESAVSTVVFPVMSVTGLLCFFYHYLTNRMFLPKKKQLEWKKQKAQDT